MDNLENQEINQTAFSVNNENSEINEIKNEPSTLPNTEKKQKCNGKLFNIISISILAVAVIVLYILHFCAPKEEIFVPKETTATPGSGEIVFINLDTINENYQLVNILNSDIQAEYSKQEAIFSNKEASFQKKYAQFQENYQNGVLTQIQIENASQQLQAEYEQLEKNHEQVLSSLQERQSAAVMQIYDSIQKVVKMVNSQRNASFVLIYQSGSPFMVYADPTKDITEQTLFELNKKFKSEKK